MTVTLPRLCLFGLDHSRDQAAAIAQELGVGLCAHEEREFEDGEHKTRPLVSVDGADVYVVQSLFRDATLSGNDMLCRLLFFIAALRDHGAKRVTAVAPYLCYGRKDQRTQPRDPVITRYVAQLFEAVGTDRVLTLDVHNRAAFDNAFRCRTVHLEALPLFVRELSSMIDEQPVVVLSPDAGGVKRADALRQALASTCSRPVGLGMMEKRRSMDVVTGDRLFADVEGCTVIIADDLIASGGTLLRTARAARAAGARRVIAVATHALCCGSAGALLNDPVFDKVLVTDSVRPLAPDPGDGQVIRVLSCASLFAQAIRALHESA